MASRHRGTRQQAYLIEHYRPSATAADLERLASQIRAATEGLEREGQPIRFRHATVVAADESVLCVVEAETVGLIRQAYAAAHATFDRISPASSEQS